MAEQQFVVFKLGEEEYGIDIMNVKEIIPYEPSVKIPNKPRFIEGIINYRGNVIPIVNLKERFDLGKFDLSQDTRIIVIHLGDKYIGFIVDDASSTAKFEDRDIEPSPAILSGIDRRYLSGVGKREDSIVILIDLEKVLSDEEQEVIEEMDMDNYDV